MSDLKIAAQKIDAAKHPWSEMKESFFHKEGDPIKVALNVVVLNLADISTASMSYRMRLEMWVAWPLTEKEVMAYVESPDTWKPNVHPDPVPWTITIEEINKMPFLSGRKTQVFLWRGKVVACECTLVTATYLESMELINFPFDCQHFNFHIGLRCDCDMPMKISDKGKLEFNTLESIDGFNNFDGRAMSRLKLDERGCTFNVRTHLLTLKDFQLKGVECEIENMEFDIPFLHCSLRLARNYESYIYRIFVPVCVICLNSTLVFRFSADILDSRLNFIITNLLTVVAFLYILAGTLPQIAYLTLVDKYMILSLLFVGFVAGTCVILNYMGVEESDGEAYLFVIYFGILIMAHMFLAAYCLYVREIEFKKITINRHEVDIYEYERLKGKVDSKAEFLVHTDIHSKKHTNFKGSEHDVYEGSYRDMIYPKEAAGWLFEGGGQLIARGDKINSSPTLVGNNLKTTSEFPANPLLREPKSNREEVI